MNIKEIIVKANELRFRQKSNLRGFKMSKPVDAMLQEIAQAEDLTNTMIVHAAIVALYDAWKK